MKLNFKDGELVLPDHEKKAARVVADIFLNSGYDHVDDRKLDWEDMYKNIKHNDTVATPDIRPLLQTSLEILIREPVEPLMVITGLFNRVEAKGMNTQVLAGAMGAVEAADVAELGTYPEVFVNIGGAMQTAYVGKSGLQASFSDEALMYSTWDIMSLNMRQMGAALVRHKEAKAVGFLQSLGTEYYNNVTPATSVFGVTTGRGLDGAANGSVRMDDLFKAMARMGEEGFQPDIILVNPQFFYLFVQDPVLRAMMLAHGGGDWFRPWNGQEGPLDPWSNGSMGGRGPSLGNRITRTSSPGSATTTGISGREHGMTSAPPLPAPYFPWPMRVVVSPFVPFDSETLLGDIYLLSSGNVGFHLVDSDPKMVEWRDESIDRVLMKINERYGFAVSNEGMGVGVLKNVKLARNYFDGTISFTSAGVTGEIDPSASISL